MSISDRIIIAGAGPVGLTTALLFINRGIAVTVLESASSLPDDLRASTFHPPTLDMLASLGLAQPLIAQGLPCPSWQIRMHETGERAEFRLGLLAGVTAYPFRLQCEQSRLAALLLDRIEAKAPGTVKFGTELLAISQDCDGVDVTTTRGPIRGRFLIGADGARSTARKQLEMTFEGATYPETTILATTDLPFEQHLQGLANVNYVWQAQGTYSLLRLRDRWRVSLYPPANQLIEDALQPNAILDRLREIVPDAGEYELGETRAYRVHMRIVNNYRRGRVFLAGDAAHVNAPSGGMGMNGGIHDAFEVVDTLIEGWSGDDDRLLDRYSRRRRSIAQRDILGLADRNRARMQERDQQARRASLNELQVITNDDEKQRAYLMRSSMIEGLRQASKIA